MRYLGGKALIARYLRNAILECVPEDKKLLYFEPFAGGMNSFCVIAPHFQQSIAADSHQDLLLMWRAILGGWVPPEDVSRAEYMQLKGSEPSPLRGFVGFACSFGGRWFEGYADPADRGRAVVNARNAIMRQAEILGALDVSLYCEFFGSRTAEAGTVVYCDPPYPGTKGYLDSLDWRYFMSTVAEWRERGAVVFISGYQEPGVPGGAALVWEGSRPAQLYVGGNSRRVVERLWVLR